MLDILCQMKKASETIDLVNIIIKVNKGNLETQILRNEWKTKNVHSFKVKTHEEVE